MKMNMAKCSPANKLSRRRFLGSSSAAIAASCVFSTCGTKADDEASAYESERSELVHSVQDLGIQFMRNSLNITGQDAATSVVLPDGNTFWIFGDTIEGPYDSIRYLDLSDMLSNTAALVPQQDVSEGIRKFSYLTQRDGKRARQFVEYLTGEVPSKHRLWAIHGICIGDWIYVYYHKITMHTDVDVFDGFDPNGMGIARARIGEYRFERLLAPDNTTLFWKGDVPGYGVFVEACDDGYVYLWGSFWTGMYLARVRPENITDLASYEYLVEAPTLKEPSVEPRWGSAYNPRCVLYDSVPNEMSAAYNSYLGKYVAVHTLLRENKIVMRTAPKITGPWSEPKLIYRPKRTDGKDIFNAGKEHPELQGQGGKVMYITYVNSAEYAPHLIEVTLA